MSRRGDEDAASTNSGDSLEERLRVASLNAQRNRLPDFPAAFTHTEPPKTDATDIRPFLKTPSDEDQAFTARLRDKSATSHPSEPSSSSAQQETSTTPTKTSSSSSATPEAAMDRRVRQSKPRLLLMGQRRYVLKPFVQMGFN